ncbi:MAG: hypothetical protein IJD40_05235 [Lachnospiraceae bacterium]|nr:hypothetical protein [Lachnospiraceae bacterium]
MFGFKRRKRIKKYANEAMLYISKNYKLPIRSTGINFCLSIDPTAKEETSGENNVGDSSNEEIKYNIPKKTRVADPYDVNQVTQLLRGYSDTCNFNEMLQILEKNVNQTFVERLLYYIDEKVVKDSEVYKAAQMDRRLFSKIVSNREYKPSKDTAIALALSLELSLDEANDMLSRAGYTFSHSSKRDIIIEYLFREKVYNLMDVNDVLHRLNQKLIGRL